MAPTAAPWNSFALDEEGVPRSAERSRERAETAEHDQEVGR
jgi:hypothetical protein